MKVFKVFKWFKSCIINESKITVYKIFTIVQGLNYTSKFIPVIYLKLNVRYAKIQTDK